MKEMTDHSSSEYRYREFHTPHSTLRTPQFFTRRSFFDRVTDGIYGAALASILSQELYGTTGLLAAETDNAEKRRIYGLEPQKTHFEPRANSVIHLFMNGGPSQMDLFDPKTELDRNHGKSYFQKIAGEIENPQAAGALMRSPFKFARHGECGMEISNVLPHLAKRADDIALIRSMHTTNLTHEPALYKIHSGRTLPGWSPMAWEP